MYKTNRTFNTQEKVKNIINEYNCGNSIINIVKKYKCNESTLRRLLKTNGIVFRKKSKKFEITNDQIDDIINKYKSGLSIKEIAYFYKVGASPIGRILHNNGVPTRGSADYKNCNRKIFFDQTFFDVIDTEAKAYFLGFLFADGCIHPNKRSVFLGLNIKDYDIIKKFAEVTNYPVNKIKFINQFNRNLKKYIKRSCIWFSSVHMVNSLIKHGCIPRKTHKLIIPVTVPDAMLRHFCRGYFDGDGCICRNSQTISGSWGKKVKISGDTIFLKLYDDVVKSFVGVNASGIYANTYTHDLVYSKKDDIVKLANWFYDESKIYLERKYLRFYSSGGEVYGHNI